LPTAVLNVMSSMSSRGRFVIVYGKGKEANSF